MLYIRKHISKVPVLIIEAYIECPENELMKSFTDDKWGITDILRACDRRIGKRRLIQMHDETENAVVREIIEKRLDLKRT